MGISLTRMGKCSAAVAFACSTLAGQAWAQEDTDSATRTLQTVTVTAQKREQSLQDVPISVVAKSGADIETRGIQRIEDLSLLVPNFSVQQDPIGDKINVRGIQSGNNAGLEQSVSTFVDGVYRGRAVQSRFSFLDIERLEVLRGPQGTLFGKNTIGGAVNITAAKPTDELAYSLAGTYTFEGVEELKSEGFVSGPLSDAVRGRLAFMYRDQSEGHVFNEFYGEDSPQIEDGAVRGQLEFDATDRTLILVRAELGDFQLDAQPFGIKEAGPLAIFEAAGAFPVFAGDFGRTNIGSVNPSLDFGSNGKMRGDSSEYMIRVEHELDKGEITAIASFSEYGFDRFLDADFSALDMLRFDEREEYEQTAFELRYASDLDGPVNFLVGTYYQDADLLAEGLTYFNVRQDGATNELAIDTFFNSACNFVVNQGADPTTATPCLFSGAIQAFDGTPLAYTDVNRINRLDQSSELYALFGQVDWELTDTLELSLGLRYAEEEKSARQQAFATDFGTRNPNVALSDDATYLAASGGQLPSIFRLVAEATAHENDLGRNEDSFTWSANLSWTPNSDTLLYARAATGFKAGGFNSFALGSDPDEAEYEEEEVLGFEVGGKLTLLDGAAELNGAVFTSEFENIQSAIFTGSTSFIVQNAAKATSSGIELDGRWAATDALTIVGSVAYVDFEFDEFPRAACTNAQLQVFRISLSQPLATLQQCSAAGVNELSGQGSENTPEISASISLDHRVELFGRYELNSVLDVAYQDDQFRSGDLDPLGLQEAYTKANLTLVLGPTAGNWDIALIGKNIFDEETFSYFNDTPVIEGSQQFIPDQPRTVGLRLRIRN
ncbi:MAG: TonB-dependent receptor [Hyphomonas sp.]